jgi:hypothetical protein
MLVILSFCHLSIWHCISCHSVAALSFILRHACCMLDIPFSVNSAAARLSVFSHSAAVCHPSFCYAADVSRSSLGRNCHVSFCYPTASHLFLRSSSCLSPLPFAIQKPVTLLSVTPPNVTPLSVTHVSVTPLSVTLLLVSSFLIRRRLFLSCRQTTL